MQSPNIPAFTKSIYSAIFKDLPRGERVIDDSHLDVYCFPQTWGSTALGFGGIGGQAMSTALSVVIAYGDETNYYYAVYFNGRHAYTLNETNHNIAMLFSDIAARNLASCREYVTRYAK